eukprot:12450709-Prorocentrum_lima.AAC.1
MCIRDRRQATPSSGSFRDTLHAIPLQLRRSACSLASLLYPASYLSSSSCLLYTSDAADDM